MLTCSRAHQLDPTHSSQIDSVRENHFTRKGTGVERSTGLSAVPQSESQTAVSIIRRRQPEKYRFSRWSDPNSFSLGSRKRKPIVIRPPSSCPTVVDNKQVSQRERYKYNKTILKKKKLPQTQSCDCRELRICN